MRRWTSIIVMLCLGVCLAGCSTNPATGRLQFNTLTDEQQEIQLGEQAAPQFLQQYGGEVPAPQLTAYVNDLGKRLAAVSERPHLPWEFHVVNSPVINAFSLPGGKVFMSRGLLVKMTNEAQLAGVLGHEIGHVTAEHIGQQMARQQGVELLGQAIGVAGSVSNNEYLTMLGAGAQAGGGLYLLHFGRSQEDQADSLGIRYMTRAGYNPQGQLQVMQILQKEAGSGGGRLMEMLSTHPLPETRIKNVQAIIQQQYPDAAQPNRYTFNPDRFKQNALDPLAKLPPPPPPPPAPAPAGK